MFGPGAYRPDPSEGITTIADLPEPEIVPYSRNDKRKACPHCSHMAYRDKQSHRTLHDMGNLEMWCPRDLVITYSQHYFTLCFMFFNADRSVFFFFFSSRRRHTRLTCDWSSDVWLFR